MASPISSDLDTSLNKSDILHRYRNATTTDDIIPKSHYQGHFILNLLICLHKLAPKGLDNFDQTTVFLTKQILAANRQKQFYLKHDKILIRKKDSNRFDFKRNLSGKTGMYEYSSPPPKYRTSYGSERIW